MIFITVGNPNTFALREYLDYKKSQRLPFWLEYDLDAWIEYTVISLAFYFLSLHLLMYKHSRAFTGLRYVLFDVTVIVMFFAE